METKLNRRLSQLKAAVCNFEASLSIQTELFPEIVKDSVESGQIQKFEVSWELLWKTVKTFLYETDGIDERSPKSVIKSFFNAGYCDYQDYEKLIAMIDDRNSLSHLYNSEMIRSILIRLKDYLRLIKNCLEIMDKKVGENFAGGVFHGKYPKE